MDEINDGYWVRRFKEILRHYLDSYDHVPKDCVTCMTGQNLCSVINTYDMNERLKRRKENER